MLWLLHDTKAYPIIPTAFRFKHKRMLGIILGPWHGSRRDTFTAVVGLPVTLEHVLHKYGRVRSRPELSPCAWFLRHFENLNGCDFHLDIPTLLLPAMDLGLLSIV